MHTGDCGQDPLHDVAEWRSRGKQWVYAGCPERSLPDHPLAWSSHPLAWSTVDAVSGAQWGLFCDF